MSDEIEKVPAFRWQYLVVYILIAALISYGLIDFKLKREAAKPTEETLAKVNVTTDDGSFSIDKENGDYVEQIDEPGTIGEKVERPSEEETSEEVSTVSSSQTPSSTKKPTESTTKKPRPTKPPKTTDPSEKPSSTGGDEPSSGSTQPVEPPSSTEPSSEDTSTPSTPIEG